jgi:hypothetical protein
VDLETDQDIDPEMEHKPYPYHIHIHIHSEAVTRTKMVPETNSDMESDPKLDSERNPDSELLHGNQRCKSLQIPTVL